MKEVNLMEILKHNCYITGDANEGEDESVHCSIESVLDVMEQVCGELLQLVKDNAQVDVTFLGWLQDQHESVPFEEGGDYEVCLVNSSIDEIQKSIKR
jgi:hypothetical protein